MDQGGSSRARVALCLLGCTVVLGFLLDLLGFTPWVLMAACVIVIGLGLGQFMGWTLAVAGATVVTFVAAVVLASMLQPIQLGLATKVRSMILAIALLWLIGMWLARRKLRLPTLASARPVLGFVAPLVVLVVVLIVLVAISAPAGGRISWAMLNDSVWNTVTARFIVDDGGLGASRPNSSPLTGVLLAISTSTGQDTIAAADLLRHDVTREAQLWLLLILTSCVLAGLIALARLRSLRPVPRTLFTLAIACIPLSSFVIGYAFQFGFYNATITLIVLLCSWIAWSYARTEPLAATVVLSASTIAMLAAWAPLAIVPLVLAAGTIARDGFRWVRELRGIRLVAVMSAIIAVPLYGAVVTLPDLLREGGALSADGGIFGFGPLNYLLVMAVALVVLVGGAVVWRSWSPLLGMGLVMLGGGVGLAFLILQRAGLDRLWGYYPVKYSWLLATLMIIVLAVAMLSWIPRFSGTRAALKTASVAVVTGSVVIGLLSWPVPTEESWKLPLSIVDGTSGIDAETVTTLFAASDPHSFTVFARYSAQSSDDQFINSWLIQQHASNSSDPARAYAYVFDGLNAAQICDLAGLVSAGLTVMTKSEALTTDVTALCPDRKVNLVVS